ncbi:hypothetical protein UK23_05035 [Lentzea aerocolonigenes]|uniref:Extracellular repeat protein, HAF family n=1 Tax=Lentzea aerocolonigenes TaxID=68170 RepID=A0A0F0HCN8_LENAE|nr:hypothetical protein [Lentzea aerocolonigenes]KJK52092.1 hypothetical protein UK23_05035 [Lentzea aerocolonigenes]
MSRRLGFSLSAALLATVVVTTPAHAATTDLGGLDGGTWHSAQAINDAGVVVGRSRADGKPERGVKYDGLPAEVAGPAGLETRLASINNSGVMAGSSFEPWVSSRATRFNPDGTYQVLDLYPGYARAAGVAIDDNGTVYGVVTDDNNPQLPVKWDATGALTRLPLPSGMNWGLVTGASNGYAVGYVLGGFITRAVRWNPDGTVTELADLDGGNTSYARAVNRHGEVVGEAYTKNNYGVAGVRWDIDGKIVTMYGHGNTHPRGINDHGVAVGFTTVTTSDNFPKRWDADGTETDLGRPDGARKAEAVSINNNGVIVGYTGEYYSPLTAVKWD